MSQSSKSTPISVTCKDLGKSYSSSLLMQNGFTKLIICSKQRLSHEAANNYSSQGPLRQLQPRNQLDNATPAAPNAGLVNSNYMPAIKKHEQNDQKMLSESRRQSRKRHRPTSNGSNSHNKEKHPIGETETKKDSSGGAPASSTAKRRRSDASSRSTRTTTSLGGAGSSLAKVELKALINESTFAKLPAEAQLRLLPLFPSCDVAKSSSAEAAAAEPAVEETGQRLLNPGALSNEFLSASLADYSKRLRSGELLLQAPPNEAAFKSKNNVRTDEPRPADTFAKPVGPPPVATAARDRRRRSRRTSASNTSTTTTTMTKSADSPDEKPAKMFAKTLASVREAVRAKRAEFQRQRLLAAEAAASGLGSGDNDASGSCSGINSGTGPSGSTSGTASNNTSLANGSNAVSVMESTSGSIFTSCSNSVVKSENIYSKQADSMMSLGMPSWSKSTVRQELAPNSEGT